MLQRVTTTLTSVISRGRHEADALRRKRDRARLMRELGELCYRQHSGEDVAATEIAAIVGQIDELATDRPLDEDEPASTAAETDDEEAPSSTSAETDQTRASSTGADRSPVDQRPVR